MYTVEGCGNSRGYWRVSEDAGDIELGMDCGVCAAMGYEDTDTFFPSSEDCYEDVMVDHMFNYHPKTLVQVRSSIVTHNTCTA